MRWTGLALWAVVGMMGCGGEDAETLTVDDFVPEAVRAQYEDLPEHVVTCVRFQYVVSHRVVDCSQDVAQVRFVEDMLKTSDFIARCQEMDDDPVAESATRACLETWATGECGDLEGGGRCSLADSWGPPGS